MMESSQGMLIISCALYSLYNVHWWDIYVRTIVYVHILHSQPLLCTVMYALLTVDITHEACYSANFAEMKEILILCVQVFHHPHHLSPKVNLPKQCLQCSRDRR